MTTTNGAWPPGQLSYSGWANVETKEVGEQETLADPTLTLEDEIKALVEDDELSSLADFLTEDDPDPDVEEIKSLLDTLDQQGLLEVKYDTSPVGTPGGKQNWVDKAGGLPGFVRAVAHALIRSGHTKSRAIQMAIGVIQNWASGRGNVSAKTRAKAVKTVAEWNAKRAVGRTAGAVGAAMGTKSWTDAIDAVTDASTFDGSFLSVDSLPAVTDSLEELRSTVCDAMKSLTGQNMAVLATWPDRMALLNDEGEVYEVGIGWNPESKQLAIGDMELTDSVELKNLGEALIEALGDLDDEEEGFDDSDPTVEYSPVQVKSLGGDLPGSYEGLRSLLQTALRNMLNPPDLSEQLNMSNDPEDVVAPSRVYGYVIATYPDYFLANVEGRGSDDASLKVGYTYDADADTVELGDVSIVKIRPTVTEVQDLGDADEAGVGAASSGAMPTESAPADVQGKGLDEDLDDHDMRLFALLQAAETVDTTRA